MFNQLNEMMLKFVVLGWGGHPLILPPCTKQNSLATIIHMTFILIFYSPFSLQV